MSSSGRVALALGGGGARGYTHIGVIQVLEERGYEVVAVSGTSMGALVGGVYAAGQLDAWTQWVEGLTQREVLRLLDPALRMPGAIRGERVMARVAELVGEARIEDLPLPFTAIASDLLARKEVWFQQGPLVMAIRAAIALPTLFPPVMLNGRLLADGGMTNPVPIAPLSGTPADLTVAVDLSGPPGRTHAPAHESAEPRPFPEWQARLRRSASQVLDGELRQRLTGWLSARRAEETAEVGAAGAAEVDPTGTPAGASPLEPEESPGPVDPVFERLPADLRTLDVMDLSLDTLQSVVTRYRLASYPPDVVVRVPKDACRTLDFHRGAEMIALGRRLTEEVLDERGAVLAPEWSD